MKVLLFLALVFSICSLSFAVPSVQVRAIFRDRAHPGKCVYEDMVLSVGQKAKLPTICGHIVCFAHSIATIFTCPVVRPPPGCTYTEYIDINAPYDECCPKKLVCGRYTI